LADSLEDVREEANDDVINEDDDSQHDEGLADIASSEASSSPQPNNGQSEALKRLSMEIEAAADAARVAAAKVPVLLTAKDPAASVLTPPMSPADERMPSRIALTKL